VIDEALVVRPAPRLPATAVRAVLWMLASGALFGVLNTIQKYLTHNIPPPEVVCLRYVVGSFILLPLLLHAGWALYRPRRVDLHLLRGGFHIAGSLIWFMVLPHVTLAQASAIGFTGPIFMMIGASMFLGERMYAARWIAVLAAFAGLLIVVWPGLMAADIDSLPSLGLLAASPLMAGSFLISKVLTRYERPEAIVFWLGIMIGLGTLPVALLDWHWPTPAQWGLLAACGVIGSSAHYCMTRSYRIADVGTVQSVRFLDLLWASLFGFLVFAHAPTIWTLAGGSLICAATIWIARHEARRRPAAAP
jgi:drug/metabolite transporter (DMT)-like permease